MLQYTLPAKGFRWMLQGDLLHFHGYRLRDFSGSEISKELPVTGPFEQRGWQ